MISSRLASRPLRIASDCAGVLGEEFGVGDEVGGHETAVGPQIRFVDEDSASPFEDQAGRPRFGNPGPIDLACDESLQYLRVGLGHDRHITATFEVGLITLVGQPRSEGHVLGVSQRRAGQGGVFELVGRGDIWVYHQECTPGGGAGDDAERLTLRLHEAVDCWIRSDEGEIEGIGEHGFDRLGAGVERGQLQLGLTQLLGEKAFDDAHDPRQRVSRWGSSPTGSTRRLPSHRHYQPWLRGCQPGAQSNRTLPRHRPRRATPTAGHRPRIESSSDALLIRDKHRPL